MSSSRASTYRSVVLQFLDASHAFIAGRDLAAAVGLPYKTVIDALDALYDRGLVSRRGRKFRAQWASAKFAPNADADKGWRFLESAWFGR